MWNLQYEANELTLKQKQMHRRREKACACPGQESGREGLEVGDYLMQTIMSRMRKQQVQGTIFNKRSEVAQLCLTLGDPMVCSLPGSSAHGIFQARVTGVGCHFLLQRIFLTQRSNLGLLHCRQTLYHLSHQGNPGLYSMVYHRTIFNVL